MTRAADGDVRSKMAIGTLCSENDCYSRLRFGILLTPQNIKDLPPRRREVFNNCSKSCVVLLHCTADAKDSNDFVVDHLDLVIRLDPKVSTGGEDAVTEPRR